MINRKYLPSANFVKAISIAVAIILIAVFFAYWWKPSTINYKNTAPVQLYASSTIMNNVDSDNDGLPDWLENLYGTDPHKADTDGDGTSDGDEVKINRDPLKANTAPAEQVPNDFIPKTLIENDQKVADEYASLNSTEKLARNLMSDILASQPTDGQTIDQSTMDTIVQKSMQDLPVLQYTGITKVSDLNIVKFDTAPLEKDVTAYKMGYYIQTENLKKIFGQDMVVLSKYMSASDVSSRLSAVTDQFQIIINNLIKLPIPALPDTAAIKLHLGLINDLEKLLQIDNDVVKSYGNDTSRVFSDLSVYNNTVTEIGIITKAIDTALKIKR